MNPAMLAPGCLLNANMIPIMKINMGDSFVHGKNGEQLE